MNEIVDCSKVYVTTTMRVMTVVMFFLCVPVYHSYARTAHEVNRTMFQQQQQRKKITGHVQNSNGEPVAGANVTEKGVANNGIITNSDGNFTLTVSNNAVIVVSYIGYRSQEVNTKDRGQVTITLQESITQMEDVVVTAFAKQKKINVTGSISTISGKEIVSSPVANITNALIGVVPG